ncbi:hypothetical protein [Rhodoblastus sp.]
MVVPDACGFRNHNKEPRAPDDLPIPPDLRQRAAAWIARHRELTEKQARGEDADYSAVVAEGQAIARELCSALPKWKVYIYDGSQVICRWPGLDIQEERRRAEVERRKKADEPRPSPPPDDSFPDKWVQIMADHCASGFWNSELESCPAEDLPVPDALRERAAAWTREYSSLDERAFEGEAVDWEPFGAEGLAIARAVKAALPDWTVFYFDELNAYSKQARETCCYEVLAQAPETND